MQHKLKSQLLDLAKKGGFKYIDAIEALLAHIEELEKRIDKLEKEEKSHHDNHPLHKGVTNLTPHDPNLKHH